LLLYDVDVPLRTPLFQQFAVLEPDTHGLDEAISAPWQRVCGTLWCPRR